MINSHVRLIHPTAATHNKPVTYNSLPRTKNSLEVLEKLAIFGNVQPQMQPHLRHVAIYASDWMSAAFSELRVSIITTTSWARVDAISC